MTSKRVWFRKKGWVHYPANINGWVVLLAALLFVLNIVFAIQLYAKSPSDLLYGIFPFAVPTFLLYEWIASHKD